MSIKRGREYLFTLFPTRAVVEFIRQPFHQIADMFLSLSIDNDLPYRLAFLLDEILDGCSLVPEPAQIIRNKVPVLAPWTFYQDDAFGVCKFRHDMM